MNSQVTSFDVNFSKIVSENFSIAGVIRSLGSAVVGSNYTFVKNHVRRLNLDTSHWLGMKHGTSGKKQRISWEKVLVENSSYHLTTSRRKKLIDENLLNNECSICHCKPIWNNKILVLRLDHINGVNRDHRITNLRFICPNCDSQTDTFCGRNSKKDKRCKLCGNPSKRGCCRKCARVGQSTKINWPSIKELKIMLDNNSYVKVGKKLGVSDNAIRKHLRSRARVDMVGTLNSLNAGPIPVESTILVKVL